MAGAESSQTNWQISKNFLKERNENMFNNTLISDVQNSIYLSLGCPLSIPNVLMSLDTFQLDMAVAESSQTNWQISKNSLKERNKHMFNNTLISDVNFSIKDSNTNRQQSLIIPAHKYILAISSQVFFAMFYGQMPDTSDTIELPDCDSDSFMEFLRFLYCDEVKLTGNCVIQVLYLANKYMVPSLSGKCTKFLADNLDANNVFSVLTEPRMFEEPSLVEKCWEMVDESSEEAINSEAFLDINKELLQVFLQRHSLNASEIDIFKAVDRWVVHQCKKTQREVTGEEKRGLLGDAINLIRFPLMTEKDFANVVPNKNLLPNKDMCDVFLYFNDALKTPLLFSDVPRIGRRIKRFKQIKTPSGPNGPWRYEGSKDSVAFSANQNISVRGVRLFGSQGGTYDVTIGIYHKQTGFQFTEEVGTFTTDKSQSRGYYGYDVLFKKPVAVTKNENYEIQALIKGPASYYGQDGQIQVTDGEITFSFSAAAEPTATRLVSGQFPEILFH